MDVGSCNANQILQNTAQSAVDAANTQLLKTKKDLLDCLGPQAAGQSMLQDVQPSMNSLQKEVDTIQYTQQFVLKQLSREASSEQTMAMFAKTSEEERDRIQKEIDDVKEKIRTERRRFKDAQPSVSPKVNGLYYTTEPDNQVLIIFIACFGSFLFITGLVVIFDKIPWALNLPMTLGERIKVVSFSWVAILVITYIYFFTYT
jgi:hypothetical protein